MMTYSLRGRLFCATFLLLATLQPLFAQRPTTLIFPDPVACDSAVCLTLRIFDDNADTLQVLGVELRDSSSYRIDSLSPLPVVLLRGEQMLIPVCFTPQRRGSIIDSMSVVLRTPLGGAETLRVRIVGMGIGPDLTATPPVINFPKTNPSSSATLTMTIINRGELPRSILPGELVLPLPFRLLTPLPLDIPAGDSVQIQVIFEPTDRGIFSNQVELASGCTGRIQLAFNGSTDIIGTGAVLRTSKVGFSPNNEERVSCGVLRCSDVVLSNLGTAPLIIENIAWSLGSLGYAITPNPPTPFVIAAGAQRTLNVCLETQRRGLAADTLVITSNNRTSIAFGMVIDISGSMKDEMDCGAQRPQRMDQAIVQSQAFIANTLLDLPALGIQDQLAISTYHTITQFPRRQVTEVLYPFPLAYINATTRQTAINSINGITPAGGTPTGEALIDMMNVLQNSPVQNRVIVLVTDGLPTDTTGYPLPQILNTARPLGIRIFTIAIGLPLSGYLESLASGTNALGFEANDCDSLQGAFEAITDILSRGSISREPFALRVLAPQLVSTDRIAFDSLVVGQTSCRNITLTNIGEGEAIVDSIALRNLLGSASSEFTLPPGVTLPFVVREGEQTEMPICFTPQRIRVRGASASIGYNNCNNTPLDVTLTGPAYAWANLRIDDERVALPGSVVTLPIRVDTSLVDYDVWSISYQLRWNASMLDLQGIRPGAAGSGATARISTPVAFEGGYATVGITVEMPPRPSPMAGADVLTELDFLVLRGDTLATLVELTAGEFADANPKTILHNAGLVAFDSTCFRDYKPIGRTASPRIRVGSVVPLPTSGGLISLQVSPEKSTLWNVAVYSANGELVINPFMQQIASGAATLDIDVSKLGSGTYQVYLQTPNGETFVRRFVVAR